MSTMLRSPSIESDLCEVLDHFLLKLDEGNKYLAHGLCNTNFAEAALLLQTSADVYGKKVDLLWDILLDYQRHMVAYERSDDKKPQVEEKIRKRGPKRKHHAEDTTFKGIIQNFSFQNDEKYDYLEQEYQLYCLNNEWHKVCNNNVRYNENLTNNATVFVPNNHIQNVDKDYIGRYDQMEVTSVLVDIFHPQNKRLVNQESTTLLAVEDAHLHIASRTNLDYMQHENDNHDKENTQLILNGEHNEKERALSTRDSLLDESGVCDLSFDTDSDRDENKCDNNRKRVDTSISEDLAFYDDDTLIENHTKDVPDTIQNILSPISLPVQNKIGNKTTICNLLLNEIKPFKGIKKKRRLFLNMKSVNYWCFEDFYKTHYKIAIGEGFPCTLDNQAKLISTKSKDVENSESDMLSSTSNNIINCDDDMDETDCDFINNNIVVNDNELQTSKGNFLVENDACTNWTLLQREEMSRNEITDWRLFIIPKLRTIDKKGDFDIHQYGSNIIGSCSLGEKQQFSHLIDGKTPREITRYFAAILQLANTQNINIDGVVPGTLSNNSLEITVLDTKRHHESLDGYQAPSKIALEKKLEDLHKTYPTANLETSQSSSSLSFSHKRKRYKSNR